MNQDRPNSLRRNFIKGKSDALVITKNINIFYLTGFRGEGVLLVTADASHLITDKRFDEEAKEELEFLKIDATDSPRISILKSLVRKLNIKRLGFESVWLGYHDFVRLKSSLKNVKLIPKRNLVENLRIIKDKYELEYLKKAVSLTKSAFFYAKRIINSRMTENDLSVRIDNFFRLQGAQKSSFPTIVAANPRSSRPHARPSSALLEKGKPILVDMGCVHRGYHSDLTRMVFSDRINSKFKSIYKIVRDAQKRAIDKIKPGVRISKIDAAARQHIANKRLAKYFIHSLGHGIGLEVHESPRISKNNKNLLRPGMVFTVEPGVYIPGWGGVRVEDMVLVTEKNCEVLTEAIPK